MSTPDATDLASRIRALADEAAESHGLYVVEVQVRGHQGSRMVEVFVDADEGAGLDDIAAVSRDLGFLLDTEDLVKGRYQLNVSSPGADRPLVESRQYRRHIGRQLKVTTGEGEEQVVRTGTLVAADDQAIDLEVNGTTERIAFDDVAEARVQLPW